MVDVVVALVWFYERHPYLWNENVVMICNEPP
jgi:hypothetical protein